jgi:hypothetical protein
LPSDQKDGIGIPDLPILRLNGWPADAPCQRLDAHLAMRNAWLGVKTVHYSFLVSDFHKLSLASLCWRTFF